MLADVHVRTYARLSIYFVVTSHTHTHTCGLMTSCSTFDCGVLYGGSECLRMRDAGGSNIRLKHDEQKNSINQC